MKKFIYSLLSLTTLALSFTACSDDDDDKNPWVAEGDAVYFSSSMPTTYVFKGGDGETNISVTVQRVYSDKELTVQLKSLTTSDDITIPGSVTFAAGEKSKNFDVKVNIGKLEYEVFQSVTIDLVADGQISQWGKSSYTFSINRLAPWIDLGMATYTDFFISGIFGLELVPYQVQMQQSEINPGLYRLVNAYGKAFPYNSPGEYDPNEVNYLVINCEDPDGVYIEMQELGNTWEGYGAFRGISYGAYYLMNGKTLEDAKNAGVCGTFKNGVISFDAKTLLTQMPGYENNPTGLFYGNSQPVTCVLPGYSIPDYSLEVYYEGRVTTTEDETFVNVSVERGKDVEEVRVGMLNTVDDADIAYYIQNDMIESVVVPSSGKVQLPLTSTQSDKYTIVAVGYNDGKVVAAANTRFLYNPAIDSEGWNYIATGNYEYSVFWSGIDSRLNLYQSQEDPKVYKIAPWGESTDFCFTWDDETGEVVVYDQPIDVEYGQYGMVYVGDLEDEDNPSEFEDDTFYFAVVYYVEAGSLGDNYESFTITSWNRAEAAPANNFTAQLSKKNVKSGLKPTKTSKIKFQGVEVK